MVSDALKRLIRERKVREDDVATDREARRIEEVRNAFFEGMTAGYDRSWLEREPADYWLESNARKDLFAGPPLPLGPELRARMGRGKRGHRYDPFRDPGRVIAASFWPAKPKA